MQVPTPRKAPLLLLLTSLALAGLGAVQAWRAQRSHRATADALLTDYGAFVAWSYADQWTGLLNSSLSSTLNGIRSAVARGQVTDECLALLLGPLEHLAGPDCGCGVALGGPAGWAFHVTYSDGEPVTRTVGPAPLAAQRQRIIAAVLEHTRRAYAPGQSHGLIRVPRKDPARALLLAYTVMPISRTDTVVYGFEVDRDRFATLFERAFDRSELLPPSLSRGRPNGELVAVSYTSPDSQVLYRSGTDTALTHPAEQRVPELAGGGVIHASVLPEVADQLIIGGLPRDRLPLLLGVFVLASALALAAVRQLYRENQLARLRSDFVASVSHELRSPLAQARLFVETLRLGRAPTEAHREWALANIDRETQRLAGLVENVLAFSRAERGALAELELCPADVGEEVAATAAGFVPLAPKGLAQLDVRTLPGLRALVHPDSLRQVLLNLLDNAVKYGPRGQTVRVETAQAPDGIRIAVEDEGPGVTADEREAIFEPFRRGRATLNGAIAGSGIGLSVVRELVHAHGGRVWVETAPGGGARFVVLLPGLPAFREVA